MIPATAPPESLAQVLRCPQDLVAQRAMPIVAGAGVKGPVSGNGGDLLLRRDLGKKVPQHPRIADMAGRDLNGPNFQCFLVGSEMDHAPHAAYRAAMLARVPLNFAFHLDPVAVHEQLQLPLGIAIGNGQVTGILAA